MDGKVTYFNGKHEVLLRSTIDPYDRNDAGLMSDDGRYILIWKTEDGYTYATLPDVEQPKRLSHRSEYYHYKGYVFQYNFTDAVVSMFSKASADEIAEEQEWKRKHNGNGLLDITDDGYYRWSTVGLRRENWENVDVRNDYLDEYIYEHCEECEYLVADAIEEFRKEN